MQTLGGFSKCNDILSNLRSYQFVKSIDHDITNDFNENTVCFELSTIFVINDVKQFDREFIVQLYQFTFSAAFLFINSYAVEDQLISATILSTFQNTLTRAFGGCKKIDCSTNSNSITTSIFDSVYFFYNSVSEVSRNLSDLLSKRMTDVNIYKESVRQHII